MNCPYPHGGRELCLFCHGADEHTSYWLESPTCRTVDRGQEPKGCRHGQTPPSGFVVQTVLPTSMYFVDFVDFLCQCVVSFDVCSAVLLLCFGIVFIQDSFYLLLCRMFSVFYGRFMSLYIIMFTIVKCVFLLCLVFSVQTQLY